MKNYFTAARGLRVIYPVHPNPVVKNAASEILGDSDNIVLTEPLNYRDLIYLLKNCFFAVTDSGGIQEEAPCLRIPVVVMRDRTERPEGVALGCCALTGNDRTRIVAVTKRVLSSDAAYRAMQCTKNPYGDGRASERIVRIVKQWAKRDSTKRT